MVAEMIDEEYDKRLERSSVAAVEKALREFRPTAQKPVKKDSKNG